MTDFTVIEKGYPVVNVSLPVLGFIGVGEKRLPPRDRRR